jgi:hypothetical protein
MNNPATQPRDELNEFTKIIIMMAKNSCEGDYWVRLRNCTLVRPVFRAAEDSTCEDAFFSEDGKYCWNLDGTSITSREYDMMEIMKHA